MIQILTFEKRPVDVCPPVSLAQPVTVPVAVRQRGFYTSTYCCNHSTSVTLVDTSTRGIP